MPHYDTLDALGLGEGKVLQTIWGKRIVIYLVYAAKWTQFIPTLQLLTPAEAYWLLLPLRRNKNQTKYKWMLTDYVSMSFGSMALQPQLDYSKVSQVLPSEPPGQPSGKAAGTGWNSCSPQFCWEVMKAKSTASSGLWRSLKSTKWVTTVSFKSRHQAFGPGSCPPGQH